MPSRVLVFGATGFTGGLICRELKAQPIDVIAAGRDEKKLNGLDPDYGKAVVDIADPPRVRQLIRRADIVVNAIGPFNLHGHGIVTAAAERGVRYLDICGEQQFIKFAFDQINPLAQKSRSLIVNSCSFESLVADLLASEICANDTEYEDISSFYHFLNSQPSIGTKLTMKLARHFPTYLLSDGDLKVTPPMAHHRDVRIAGLPELTHAGFFPFPEVLFFARRFRTRNAGSYYLFEEGQMEQVPLVAGRSPQDMERTLERFRRTRQFNPTDAERESQQFRLAVVAKVRGGERRQVVVRGKDMYNLTAKIMAQCVALLLEGRVGGHGVKTPAEAFGGKALLDVLFPRDSIQRA